jgi:hypothetical protein
MFLGLAYKRSSVATQVRFRMATKYGRSNGSFHRVIACNAGSPGFDSRLRHNILRCSMERMEMAMVKSLHSGDPDVMRNSHAGHAFGRISMRMSHATGFSHDPPSS